MTRNHIDGGTVETLALHSRPSGWALAVARRVGYRGNVWFEVQRVTPTTGPMANMATAISRHATETGARKAANAEWVKMG